jgi:hypothetical protein
MEEKVIYGCAETGKVWIGEQELDIARSLKFENKSPTGFSWGFHGAGPSQLALAILLEVCEEATALRLYQQFKQDIIAEFPSEEDLVLPVAKLMEWLKSQEASNR